jgi:O-succinylbenzoate synthase
VLEAKRIHDLCLERRTPVWCGGMLETGVGRALNLSLAALPGFTLPGDTSASARYFDEDLTAPFELAPDGTMAVPTGPGIGVEPRPDRLRACLIRGELLRPQTKSDKTTGPA